MQAPQTAASCPAMAECFCGCGRRVRFGRGAPNKSGRTLSDELRFWQAASGVAEQVLGADALGENFLTTGEGYRSQLAAIVHGERELRDLDQRALRRWLHDSLELRANLGFRFETLPRPITVDPAAGERELEEFIELTSTPCTSPTRNSSPGSPKPTASSAPPRWTRRPGGWSRCAGSGRGRPRGSRTCSPGSSTPKRPGRHFRMASHAIAMRVSPQGAPPREILVGAAAQDLQSAAPRSRDLDLDVSRDGEPIIPSAREPIGRVDACLTTSSSRALAVCRGREPIGRRHACFAMRSSARLARHCYRDLEAHRHPGIHGCPGRHLFGSRDRRIGTPRARQLAVTTARGPWRSAVRGIAVRSVPGLWSPRSPQTALPGGLDV